MKRRRKRGERKKRIKRRKGENIRMDINRKLGKQLLSEKGNGLF